MSLKVLIVACLLALAESKSRFPRLVNGNDALPGEFPHQVIIQLNRFGKLVPLPVCGGSILDERWIVTAAHCITVMEKFSNQGDFHVTAGKKSALADNEADEQSSLIEKVIVHDKYSPLFSGVEYDIALIKLKTPFTFNNQVNKIPLPEQDSEPNGFVQLSGWGMTNTDIKNPRLPLALQKAILLINDRDTCNTQIENLNLDIPPYYRIHVGERNICTHKISETSACVGDTGSPLISKKYNGQPSELVGIVTFSYEFCGLDSNAPGVYVRVSAFVDWIKQYIEEK